ncbi:hypothetical protein [Thermoflavimicrobium daqui]|uniref:Uncharacterized protein n=1 Tax=Thermoflavimicrobium daqui TaxID=2137476 RepID=A0A364K6K6_9BACL|nr:hypothetical protein [Thermoflavimicrobium daqui]RAL25941.1 hypothetical protein DL897_07675 [Thermoflavimicrobium daqui]
MIKMQVLGDRNKVNLFMKDFKSLPQYHVITESIFNKFLDENVIGYTVFDLINPVCKPIVLQITTSNEKELLLDLRNAQVVKSDNGVTWIKGKVNDIYW